MTDKYLSYLTMLAQRDQIMLILFVSAAGLVLSWFGWPGLRRYMLPSGLALYILIVIAITVSIHA